MLATPPNRLLLGIIPWYSALIVCGICAALFIASREEKRMALPQDTVVDLALWAIPFGVIGARLYYVAFAWDTFAPDPLSVLYIWKGGMAIYGAVLGGLMGVFIFSRRRKIALPRLTDMIVPGLSLAQAIGRWGNYFNIEAYGLEITDPALQFFPLAVLIPGHTGSTWHMATFFYESVWDLLVFVLLMSGRKRVHRVGDTTLWYILLYGSGRLVIEGLRTDSLMAGGGAVRISQLLSVLMGLAVVLVFLLRSSGRPGKLRCIAAAAAVVTSVVASLLLPSPADAFHGYAWAWLLQAALLSAGCTLHPLRSTLPALIALVLAFAGRYALAVTGVSGVESSTLLCILFGLTTIVGGASFYHTNECHT